jgi:hypothetical protein
MTQRESFDSFYTKKLESLKIRLKDIIMGDIPYVVGPEYACRHCGGRIFLHTFEGALSCLLCAQMPTLWSKETKRCVAEILQSYPSYEESMKEWEAGQAKRPTPRFNSEEEAARKRGDIELGKKIQEAREKRGWNRTELGNKIYKADGGRLTKSAIQNYETAHSKPRKYILDQLVQILELQLEE